MTVLSLEPSSNRMMENMQQVFFLLICESLLFCRRVFLHCFEQAAVPFSANSSKSPPSSPSQPVVIVCLCAQVMSLMMCEWRVVSLLSLLAHGRTEALMTPDRTLLLELGELRGQGSGGSRAQTTSLRGNRGFQTLIRMTLGLGAGGEGVLQRK